MGGVDAFLAWQIGSLTPKINICDFHLSYTIERNYTTLNYCLSLLSHIQGSQTYCLHCAESNHGHTRGGS